MVTPIPTGRDVIAFYTDSEKSEEGIIAPAGMRFFLPQKVPRSGNLKRFLVQFPAGTGYLVTVRLFYSTPTNCLLPVYGYGYIQMENDKYDNPHLHIPVKIAKNLYVEIRNSSMFQQQLFALAEIEPNLVIL
ncbi:hypothetical protein ES707_03382 [subsurface metagenome]